MPRSIRPHRHLPLAYLSGFWSLLILLVLSSGPAYAEWVEFAGNDDAGMSVYVDPGTIRRKGDLVKMWNLKDYKTVQAPTYGAYLSFKGLDQYDCAEESIRPLAITYFSLNMGSGKVVYTNADEGKRYPVQPGSIGEALWKFACSKK